MSDTYIKLPEFRGLAAEDKLQKNDQLAAADPAGIPTEATPEDFGTLVGERVARRLIVWRKLPVGTPRREGDYAKHPDAFRATGCPGTPVTAEVDVYRWYDFRTKAKKAA